MSYVIDEKQQTSHKETEVKLFNDWIHHRSDETANQLVKRYLPLVHIITEKIYRKLPHSVPKEEIKSLGLIGLYEAIEKYDPNRDLKFETYASFRIRGSILDGLRKEDWLPRKTREKTKRIEGIIAKLEQKLLRNVTVEEIAKEANLPIDEVQSLLSEIYFSNILSLNENYDRNENDEQSYSIEDENIKTPEEELLFTEKLRDLKGAIKQLNDNEQLVLSLFYKEELTFTEIGHILERSTSRISQIHSSALKKLNRLLQENNLD